MKTICKSQSSFVCFMTLLFFFALFTTCTRDVNQRNRESGIKQEVLRRGELRAAYAVYPPASIKDPNTGEISGIFVDVLEEVASRLDVRLVWTEEVPWGTMIEGLRNQRYDIIGSGVWANAARARAADFTVPLYFNGINVYVRANDMRFDKGLESLFNMDISTLKIAVIDGEMSDLIARSDFPDARLVSLPQLSDGTQLLLEVATGKADITFVQPFTADSYLAANPESIKNIDPDRPIRVFPASFMLNEGELEMINMLNVVINELIYSGYVDRAIDKYAPGDDSFYRVKTPYLINQASMISQ